jgi:tRNA pseudouridine32 synthase / 23S rRNA pseudouridine746 synthase
MVCGMSSSNAFKPPVKNGVGPSTVGIPANTSLPAIDFLAQKFSAISREAWLQRFENREILNAQGRVMAPQDILLVESHLHYYRSIPNEPELPWKAKVIFQDDYLVVADKPHFMPVTPGGRYVQQSLLVQLKQQLNLPELSPLHRIDRETAGLVVFSVRSQDRNAYQELFRLRQVQKTYEAIAGAPETSPMHLQFPLIHRSFMAEDSQFFRMLEVARHEHNDSLEFNSETWIDCMERLYGNSALDNQNATQPLLLARYLLKPLTGQRHQLRVHMNSIGLPLLNDQFYPQVLRDANEKVDFNAPLQLLAQKIAFKDPVTGASRSFESSSQLTALK